VIQNAWHVRALELSAPHAMQSTYSDNWIRLLTLATAKVGTSKTPRLLPQFAGHVLVSVSHALDRLAHVFLVIALPTIDYSIQRPALAFVRMGSLKLKREFRWYALPVIQHAWHARALQLSAPRVMRSSCSDNWTRLQILATAKMGTSKTLHLLHQSADHVLVLVSHALG
jgi:hypothetical protein